MIRPGGDLDDRELEAAEPAARDARPNAPRTGGRTGDTGTRPGMVRRNLYAMPPGAPPGVTLSAPCIFRLFS